MPATGIVPSRLREVLREWAGLRADAGDHRGAYELTARRSRSTEPANLSIKY